MRTALIARELRKYQIDIAAVSETRIAEDISIAEPNQTQDTHSSGGEGGGGGGEEGEEGEEKDEDRIHGVGLSI